MSAENHKQEGHGDKTITIIVDGTPYEVPKNDRLEYDEVVDLAYPGHENDPNISYSITYTRGPHGQVEGILPPDGSVKAKDGMSFIVNRTGQS